MESKTSEMKKLLTYTVWNLDVWGHSHDECHNHECPCVSTDPENPESYDNPPECQCGYDVNDRWRVGKIMVEVNARCTHDDCNAKGCEELKQHCEAGIAGVPDDFYDPSEAQIIAALVDMGFLTKIATPETIDVEDLGQELMFINERADGCPLYQLEFESVVTKGGEA